jgi:hypothetical protein
MRSSSKARTTTATTLPCASTTTSRPGYFHTAGTRLVAGRDFTWAEIYNVRPIGIVSESLARELWGSPQAAIGKRFHEFPSHALA